MKKKKLFTFGTLLLVCSIVVGISVTRSKPTKDQELRSFLIQAGFNNVPNMVSYSAVAEKKYWMNTYGLHFLTTMEVDTLCKVNNFVMAKATQYKGSLPTASAKEIQINYKKIKDEILSYEFRVNWDSDNKIFFSENEVGWWLSGEKERTEFDFTFLNTNLADRLNKKGKKVMLEDYKLVSLSSWRMFTGNFDHTGIKIIADITKFNTIGSHLEGIELKPNHVPKPDPIAVMQHRNGYIILAKW